MLALLFAVLLFFSGGTENANALLLPDFALPYYGIGPQEAPGTYPYWSGGPHQWARDPSYVYVDAHSGSGIDFARGGHSFTVASMTEGEVIYVNATGDYQGLGHVVAVRNSIGGTVVIYAHLDTIYAPLLAAYNSGETYYVKQGYQIGRAGMSGAGARGTLHLHVELRDGTRGCCGITGDFGNPVSWAYTKVGNYMILEYRVNEWGVMEDPSDPSRTLFGVSYNYDGYAIKVSGPDSVDFFDLVAYSDFQYCDDLGSGSACSEGDSTHRTHVYTRMPADFSCDVTNCESVEHPSVVFAYKGFLGGGLLLSEMGQPSDQSQPNNPEPVQQPGEAPAFPSWLQEFNVTANTPSSFNIHTKVEAVDGVYASHRLSVDGVVIHESSAAEINFDWIPNGFSTGNHMIKVEYRRVNDPTDWSGALSYEAPIFITAESNPPETHAEVSEVDGNNNWHISPAGVSFVAFDDTGVSKTYFTVNGGSTSVGNSLSLAADGIYSVCFWSVDVYGNTESQKCIEVKIDQTPPEVSGTLTGPRDINGIFRDAVSANLNPTDNLSGVANVQCSPNSGSSWTTLDPWSFTIEGQGVHQYTCKAEDMAGNVSEDLDSGPVIINTYAIFSSDPNDGLVIDRGTGDSITGDLYSEGAVLFDDNTGSVFNGTLHIVNGDYDFTSGNTNVTDNLDVFYNVDHVDGISYPFSYYWQRCDQVYDDDLEIDSVGISISGVICVDGDLDVTATTVNGDVTFVVNGDIEFNPTRGAYRTTDPDNGLVMYATGNIDLLGTDYLIVGHVYAPNGDIVVRATDLILRGSLVALHVEFYTSTDVTLEYEPAFEAQTFNMPLANDGFADPDNGDTGGSGGGTVPATATPAPTATATPLPTQTPLPSPTPLPTSTPMVTPTPVVEIPCDTCDYHYTGYLNAGDSVVIPSTYFYVDSYGYLDGWLNGDNPDANFDLYLYRWSGSSWMYAGSRTSNDSEEHLRRFASPGYYVWVVMSDSGSGNYELWVDVP